MGVQRKEFANVAITQKDGVATVTLNRPTKMNALDPELIEDFIPALGEVAADDTARAVIITGAGRSFSAGGDIGKDIAPLRQKTPSEFNSYMSHALQLYKVVMDMEKPVIAAINGYALGAGLDLAMSCDIRIAAENAQLGEFFVRIGLTPEIGIYLMPRLIGLGKAKLLSLTGDLINAKEAEQIGLVEKVVPADKLIPSAEELAGRLAKGPKAIGIIKKAFHESLWMSLDSSLDYIMRLQYQLIHTDDHKEAVDAALEKRTPVFRGK